MDACFRTYPMQVVRIKFLVCWFKVPEYQGGIVFWEGLTYQVTYRFPGLSPNFGSTPSQPL
jgi:hypothetical protein